MAIRRLVVIAAAIISTIALLLLAKPLSQILVSSLWPQKIIEEKPLAEVLEVVGPVERQSPTEFMGRPLVSTDKVIRHRDRLTTGPHSFIVLKLKGGYEIRIEALSEVVFESWNSDDNMSPTYLSFLSGDFALIQSGRPGSVYISQDKKLFSPELRPQKESLRTIAPKSSEEASFQQELKVKEASLPEEPEKEPETPADTEEKTESTTAQKKDSKTLETRYIEEVLGSRNQLFRRCRLTSLRDQKQIIGNLLYTFSIEPNGSVTQVRLLQTDIYNAALQSCVASVIERTKFKTFSGSAIQLSYPIRFD